MNIPNDAIQIIIEFSYPYLVNSLSSIELDVLSDFINSPLQIKYEDVIESAQNFARKLIFNPSDQLVKFLRFENYVVPLDVALGGYYLLPVPFTSYATLTNTGYNKKSFRFAGKPIVINLPELVIPSRISKIVNEDNNITDNHLRLAVVRVAEELNHPAIEDDYQGRVWSIIKSNNLDKFGASMKYLIDKFRRYGITGRESTAIRQYFWRAIFGDLGITDDEFTIYKDRVGSLITGLRQTEEFYNMLRGKTYNDNDQFKNRRESVIIEHNLLNNKKIPIYNFISNRASGRKSKFREFTSEFIKELRLNIQKDKVSISNNKSELPPLPLEQYRSASITKLKRWKQLLPEYISREIDIFINTSNLYRRHVIASNIVNELIDWNKPLAAKSIIEILANGRSFEDLVNVNIMYPRVAIPKELEDKYMKLNLNIPLRSSFALDERLRIMVEQVPETEARRLKGGRGSWLQIMGKMINIDTNLPENEFLDKLIKLFDWKGFSKTKTGVRIIEELTSKRSKSRIKYIYSKVKSSIEFQELIFTL